MANNDITYKQNELLRFIDRKGYITILEAEHYIGNRGLCNRLINELKRKNYIQIITKYDDKPRRILLCDHRAYLMFKKDKKYAAERQRIIT
jgi:hypothetical protein